MNPSRERSGTNPRSMNRHSFPWFLVVLLLAGWGVSAALVRGETPRIFLIGGSTMANFPQGHPKPGWGQQLPKFFNEPGMVRNHARSGRSSKSFIDQGLWDKVKAEMQAGDYLIVHFGTNDSKVTDPARFVEPRGQFRVNLERFVDETRAKGAFPILATSLARRVWDDQGVFVDDGSEYVVVTREVAAARHVPLLEMRLRSIELERSLGVEGSIRLHAYVEPGANSFYPKGLKDNTHYSEYGATRIAALAVEEFRRLELPFVRWLVSPARAAALTEAASGESRPRPPGVGVR